LGACSETSSDPLLVPVDALTAAFDSAGGVAQAQAAAANGDIVLPQRSALQVELKERNAAWWHDLSVVVPEDLHLVGPGYLFPGPVFNVGPYDPGPVVFQLDSYNPREPHQFFGTASYRVTGAFPVWQVEFEDGGDGDFDDIIIEVRAVVTAATLELDCTPTSVVRGDDVACTASANPASSTLVVKEWSFADGSGLTAGETSSTNPWMGPLVVSGTVTVRADVDGAEMTADAPVTVQARNWSNELASFNVVEDNPGPLPVMPTVVGDLGQIGYFPQLDPGKLMEVPAGPNQRLYYLTGIPYGIEARVNVNTVALAQGSAFWQKQAPLKYINAAGDEICGKADVLLFPQVVRDHEGIGMMADSHARLFKDKMDQLMGPALEGAVAGTDFELVGVFNPLFLNVVAQADLEDDKADLPPLVPMFCFFTY